MLSVSFPQWQKIKDAIHLWPSNSINGEWSCTSLYLPVWPSIRLSICLSATHISLCSCHIIMQFPGVVTTEKSDVHARDRGQTSKVKVTEVKTNFPQFGHFSMVTPVWIHRCLQNDAQSLKGHIGGVLLFFKVITKILRLPGTKSCQVWPALSVYGL